MAAGSDGVAETETAAQQPPRRSSRLNKKQQRRPATTTTTTNKNGTSDVFSNMDLKTCQLEGHHHDICSVDMHGKYVVSVGYNISSFFYIFLIYTVDSHRTRTTDSTSYLTMIMIIF